jgi:hypothetical protein
LLQALDLARYAPLALAGVNYSVDLWNWGQPRVGDATFADAVSLERANGGLLRAFYRSTHLEDPVPHLPFILFGFYHAAVEKYNNVINGTSYRNCTGGEDPNCADSNHFFDPAQHLTYWGLNQVFYERVMCANASSSCSTMVRTAVLTNETRTHKIAPKHAAELKNDF